ncbi:MAG TPA: LLM class flavin-dependent oxidoreductase [Gaiellaceae bacterium]|nr:LLM class flavin-dependent oxidoreductase [Gaiellaceae bacterium]
MKISAQFMPGDLPVFLDSVRKAEEAGYARAYLVEGQLLWRDVYVYMTHGLAATERIVFGTAVTNPRTRHYSVIASAHATLAELHPGRVVLGMGRGDNAVRTLGLKQVSTSQLREVAPKLRELMAGRAVDCDGTDIRIQWASEAIGKVPVMLSASGPRTLRMAGAVADIVMLQVGVNPEAVKWAVDIVKAGAEEAGRDPGDVETTLYTAMWVSDDLDEARSQTRWAAACAANHVADVMRNVPDHGMPEALTRLAALRGDHYDYASHLDPSVERSEYPDEVIDDFAFNGPPERIVDMLRALAAVGLDEVAPCYLNGRLDEMDVVGREIIPAVSALAA